MGTFDGVHLGHRKIINMAVDLAKRNKTISVVLTFDPHPQQFIVPERGLRLLTSISERISLLSKMNVDVLVIIKFDKSIQTLTYEKFIKKIIVGKLKAKAVCVGYDFAFGRERSGNIDILNKLANKLGFSVYVKKPVKVGNMIVKSSLIRQMISFGEFKEAVKMLCHPYRLIGRVVRGYGRGSKLGFPTANIDVDKHKLIPAHGVYSCRVNIGTKKFKGVVNIGSRPTFADGHIAIEVYIINFSGNIRNKTLRADLVSRLRPEIQFSDVEDLKNQIKRDIDKAKRILS